MKKLFVILFLAGIFSINSFAQNQPATVSKGGFIVLKANNDTANRPRVVEAAKNISTFDIEHHVLDLINKKRAENGMSPLRWSEDAAKIARLHSGNMAEYKFFSHIGRDGLAVDERADSLGLSKWKAIGENIAYNRGFENPLEFACEGWMKSPAHRENLLNSRWKETGIGISIAADGTYYFTQVFLQR